MINVTNLLMESWYELLNENISVNVYRTNAPVTEKGNYVVLRKESESEVPLGSRIWTKPIMVVEIVTRFPNSNRDDVSGDIDNEISQLWSGAISNNNLPVQSGIQISNVYKQTVVFLDEFTGSEYIYRHITRYRHDITQHKN